MGLLPLEFTDCLQDSPYFRDRLHSHEKELERTSQAIKELIKEVKSLLSAAKGLSQVQRRLSQRLIDFKFECIGNRQTDDEIIIASSLKEFGKLIAAIEDEKDRMLERAYEQFIEPLEEFRRKQIGAVKERKKKFEKQTAKFCASQERYLGLSTKKQDTVLQEADATLEMEQRDFVRAGLEYVDLIQEVQERKKFEFVETLLAFMYGWLTFYHQGHEVAKDFNPHMTELQSRIQKTRENFNASRADIQALMRKMLEVRSSKPIDPGTLNKLYTRSGYLFLQEKKAIGHTWNKYYCHYQRDGKMFCMIPYNQTTPKIVSNETFKLKACIKKLSDSIDKRFCFDIIPEDKPSVPYTFQALSEEDRDMWLEAMDGKEPMYEVHPKRSDANETYLDESGFYFIQRSFQVLESRGLEEQGLYRVVGVSSKVTKLLTMGLDRRKSEKMNLEDNLEWESKTLTSAIKTYFRNLPEPIMTFRMHSAFIAAAKLDSYEDRVNEVHRLVDQIPEPNKRMLEILLEHLEHVAEKCDKNMMTVSNLGVCFGPTLLRAEEETVAAIMDIKFGNVVVEILIENWRKILKNDPTNPTPLKRSISSSEQQSKGSEVPKKTSSSISQLSVLPVSPRSTQSASRIGISPPNRPPPPYQNPPPPPVSGSSVAALASAVLDKNGPKQVLHVISPPSVPPPAPPSTSASGTSSSTSNSNSSYATWERPLRQSVPLPLNSAPVTNVPDGKDSSKSWYNSSRSMQRQASSGQNTATSESASGLDYPPLAPRPQLSQRSRPYNSSRSSVGNSANNPALSGSNIVHKDSSSSSMDSLTSSGSHALQGNTQDSVMSRSAGQVVTETHSSPYPVASPRLSLTGTNSAPIQASVGPSTTSKGQQPSASSQVMDNSSVEAVSPPSSPKTGTATPKTGSAEASGASAYRTVRTLYACVAEHESELSFEPNQIITKVRPSLEPGWLEGCLNGNFGLVPENYVEYIT